MMMIRCFLAARCQWRMLFAVLFCVLSTATHAAEYFTINIGSSLKQPDAITIQDEALAQKYIAYSVKLEVNGITRYRQRIGFFVTKTEAQNALQKISAQFPGAWIDKAQPGEDETLYRWLGATTATAAVAAEITVPTPEPVIPVAVPALTAAATTPSPAAETITPEPMQETDAVDAGKTDTPLVNTLDSRLAKLMDDAKLALVEKNYEKAIQIYTKVTNEGDSAYKQEAQEYLGVARERNGQLAHATAEYKKYLQLYPSGEDAERVKQRLNGLLTAADKPQARMQIAEKEKQPAYWDAFGTAYQFYDRDSIKSDMGDRFVANSLLSSGFNHSARLVNSDYKIRTNFSAIHIYDFIEKETDRTRVNDLYVDMISPEQVFDARVGRQKGRSSGVIGRFDGFDAGYRFNPSHQIRLMSGFPVEFSGQTVAHETDKRFISVGYNWTGFLPDWEVNFFTLQQVADGITDREEIGGELRYRTEKQSFFSMLDYSTAFSEINYLMMIYNRQLPEQATLDVILDYRKSPFLTTSSSLQGQINASTMAEITAALSEEELEQLALARTGLYKSLTAIYTRLLREDLEFNTDFSISNLSGTAGTIGTGTITDVPPQEGTGNEYSYSAGLVSSNLLTDNDINIVNARYSDLFNSKVISLSGSSKYRLYTDWRIGPRLQIDKRDYDDGRSSNRLAPSVRIEYRQNKNWQFETELTFESKSVTSTTSTDRESNYFLHLGYFYSF